MRSHPREMLKKTGSLKSLVTNLTGVRCGANCSAAQDKSFPWLGVSAQSPAGKGNTVTFENIALTQKAITNFRLGE